MTRGFRYSRNLNGGEEALLQMSFMIKNSGTLTIGDAIKTASGYADVCGAGDRVLGIAEGFIQPNNLPVNHRREGHGATVSGSGLDLTVVTASDNQTVDKLRVQVRINPSALYVAVGDDDLSQALIGTFFDTTSAGDVIDTSTSGASGQFLLLALDPDGDGNAKKGLFAIAETALRPVDAVE
jgi:hypothetical protein